LALTTAGFSPASRADPARETPASRASKSAANGFLLPLVWGANRAGGLPVIPRRSARAWPVCGAGGYSALAARQWPRTEFVWRPGRGAPRSAGVCRWRRPLRLMRMRSRSPKTPSPANPKARRTWPGDS